MREVEAAAFRGPEVLILRNVPAPSAGSAQVIVQVSVVPVLFLDTQIRRGAGLVSDDSCLEGWEQMPWSTTHKRIGPTA